jgi:hypothetical protein
MNDSIHYLVQPYALAGEHRGKWKLTITRVFDGPFIEEQRFHCTEIFDSQEEATKFGLEWVAWQGGQVRKPWSFPGPQALD